MGEILILMDSLSAIVLAGGQSSRMGQDKALLQIEGVPLLTRVCRVALHCADPVYVVARSVGGDRAPQNHPYAALLPPSCTLVLETGEDAPPSGPLVGFAEGLSYVQTEWVLLLACDLPRLQGEVLQGWQQQLAQVAESAIALLPRHAKGWEPLCGFYRRNCLPSLTAFIQAGGRSFQSWLAQHYVQVLEVEDFTLLMNCNTPEDWQELR